MSALYLFDLFVNVGPEAYFFFVIYGSISVKFPSNGATHRSGSVLVPGFASDGNRSLLATAVSL